MKIYTTNSNSYYAVNRNLNFTSTGKNGTVTKDIIKHFGLNMETMVGYQGKRTIAPIPENVDKKLAMFFKKLQVDWNTHVNSTAETITKV